MQNSDAPTIGVYQRDGGVTFRTTVETIQMKNSAVSNHGNKEKREKEDETL